MNREEAKDILANQVRELQKLSYADWRTWVIEKRIETPAVTSASGIEYQVELQAMWDGKQEGVIRVVVSVDDGGLMFLLLPPVRFIHHFARWIA